jgi:PAS domain S-box-containing protein
VQRILTQQFLDIAGGIIVALNSKGEITLVNSKACKIVGYTETHLIGKNWFDLCIPGRHRTEVKEAFRKIITGEMAAVEQYENPVLTQSGHEYFIVWTNTLLKDDNGRVIGTLSSGVDITERRQIEESLRESAARLHAIVETAVDGIITINENGIIESVNSSVERLFGYTSAELVGRNVSVLMPTPYREEHDTYLSSYLKTGRKKIIGIGREVMGMRKDGATFPLRLSVSEFKVGDRRMFTGIVHDISEQKTLQHQILQTERLAIIGKMAAKVAHEIRNPLSSISLNAELLQDEISDYDCNDTSEATSLLKSMIREIDRVSALTDEYLQFSRLPVSQPVRANFDELIRDMKESMDAELKQKKIDLDFQPANQPLRIRIDRSQFRRALLNIVRNAIEAMPQGGKIAIWSEQKNDRAILYIQDSGTGISEDMLDKIFDPFFTTKDFGTGLGLAVTQQVISEHGGQIACSSKMGVGTTFAIELPLDSK